ncbi:calcium/sodium antiporter [Rhizobiales bacterium]|uniref:calcium/sodium antiporter n=1 Tax=Hongsoonwoonella zoysiae TaxID=2821844 RepID=UPI0015606DDD|nr:calcium/sodium antiporter [Hongsoonwoonella zoysiae]NRG17669.1 calcium/sodium antiporter [Hongsoonwoonella zoysiae]
MLIEYVSLLGGLVVLIVAGDVLVRGSVGIAERLGIPSLIIGLTIVAFGTSAPELVISLDAALNGLPGIAVGNVVGSNVANVLLVLGLPALVAATSCQEKGALRNAVFMTGVSIIFVFICFTGTITRTTGGFLVILLAVFLADSVLATRKHKRENRKARPARDLSASAVVTSKEASADARDEDDACTAPFEEVEGVPENIALAAVFVVLGLVGLPLGAHFTIEGASALARSWGVTEAVIGLTVVALGTSLPELATSLMAALRNHSAVALGNIIGSNVFNILAIMGITGLVTPVRIPPEILSFELWVMLACAFLVLALAALRTTLRRPAGMALVTFYAIYMATSFALGQAG